MIRLLVATIATYTVLVSVVSAQTSMFAPVRTTVVTGDSVRCRVAALNNNFTPLSGNLAALTVTDNGSRQTVVQTADAVSDGRNLSLMVAVDLSSSMDIARPSTSNLAPLAITKQAIGRVAALMVQPFDELGLMGVGARSELFYALSAEKSAYANAAQALQTRGGYNLRRGLFDTPQGALTHLQNARNSRALLLFTDGNTRFDVREALSTARTFGIKVYVVGIGTVLSSDMRALADSSGGAFAELVASANDASMWASAFVVDAKQLRMWTLTWPLPEGCDSVRAVQVADNRVTRLTSYAFPQRRTRSLAAKNRGIDFGLVKVGDNATTTVTVSAPNATVTISDIQLTIGSGFEVVSMPPLPVVLTAGNSLSFDVRYTAVSTDANYDILRFTSDACRSDSVIVRAGSLFDGETVKLVRPNGGEQFVAGRDTVVQWTNALPQDFMRLEVSSNAGTSWSTITESAQGLSYHWSPGPSFGDQCLMRITGTAVDQRTILRLRGQTQPVYCVAFSPDDRLVITGGDDGTVRTWDAVTGEQVRVIGIHGNWVWALATMPGTSQVASGSHDGTVRVWDYRTSARVATLNFGARVWSVAFSQDGKVLFAGTERGIAIVNTDSWSIEKIIDVPEGPVYDLHVSAGAPYIISAEGSRVLARSTANLDSVRVFTDPTQTGSIYAVAMPSTNDVVITGGADFILRKYRFSDGQLLSSAPPSVGSILGLSYSSDNSRILSAGGDATAKLHSAENLSVQVSLAGHDGIVYGAAFSSDDSTVATVSTDFTARIWPLSKLGTVSDVSDAPFAIEGAVPEYSDVSMGDTFIGSGRDTITAVLRNTSSKSMVVRSVRLLASGQQADFDIATPGLPITLAAGQTFPLDVSFTPADVGARQATVEITSGAGVRRITLSGRGVRPALQVREVLDFGRHVANQAVIDSTITIVATGDASVSYSVSLTTILGEQSSMFSIKDGGAPFTMRGGESHRLTVRFDPRTFGRFAAFLVLQIDGQGSQVVRLYGEATGEGRLATGAAMLFASNSCESAPSQRTFTLRNSGNSQTIIYSIGIEGADADEFTVTASKPYPITMEAKDSLQVAVSFTPRRVGVKDVRVVVSSNASNALNGRTVVNMSARRDSVGFELSRSTISFPNVAEGESLSDRLQIINTGTITLQWPRGGIDLGAFRIDSITPDITPGGRNSSLLVTFLGGIPGRTYDTSYTFVDTICGRRQTLRLTASVKSIIGATIRVGSVGATTGQLITVPVFVTGKVNFSRTAVREVTAHLSTNGTVLTPSGSTPVGKLGPDGIRRFSVVVPLTASDSLATTLTMQTTWGNDTASFIRIDSVTASDTLTFRLVNGQVRILDICRVSGRPRLISFTSNGAGLMVTPSPASDRATLTMDVVERGHTNVRIYDAASRLVAVAHDGPTSPGRWIIPLDLTALNSGAYFVVMTTASESFTQRVEVVR